MSKQDRAIELLKEGEGSISHMYLDTRANVTAGVGQLLATVAAAQELPFVHRVVSQNSNAVQVVLVVGLGSALGRWGETGDPDVTSVA